LGCVAGVIGCASDGPSASKSAAADSGPPSASALAVVNGSNQFAFDLYHRLITDPANKNLIFSPQSISTAIAMLEGGARGRTKSEIDAALHFTLPESRLHDAANARTWLAEPQHGLAGRRPRDLLASEFGRSQVRGLLKRIEHGFLA